MPRSFNSALRADFESPHARDVVLVFLILTHPDWSTPIRLVNDVVNYTWNGNLFIGYPFKLEYLSDDDKAPRGTITVQNVDAQIGEQLRGLVYGPFCEIDVLAASDWHTAIDVTTNSRLPIGTPTLELSAKMLQLWDITVDEQQVQATIGPPDLTQEMWPIPRCTKSNTPGLFR